jgi:hypothetical protein
MDVSFATLAPARSAGEVAEGDAIRLKILRNAFFLYYKI